MHLLNLRLGEETKFRNVQYSAVHHSAREPSGNIMRGNKVPGNYRINLNVLKGSKLPEDVRMVKNHNKFCSFFLLISVFLHQ